MYLIFKKNVSVDLKRSTLGRSLQPVLLVSAGGGQLNATLSTTCATYLKCKQHKHPNYDHYSSSVEEREKQNESTRATPKIWQWRPEGEPSKTSSSRCHHIRLVIKALFSKPFHDDLTTGAKNYDLFSNQHI